MIRRWRMKVPRVAMWCKGLLAAGLLALASALKATALGQECVKDADCPEGMVCVAAPCKGCEPNGGACEPCPERGECVAKGNGGGVWVWGLTCESDADCPYAFLCEEMEMPCTGGWGCEPCTCRCPADGECPPCECPPCPEPEPCTPEVVKVCVFEPVECATDADCDAGFECREIEQCVGEGCVCPGCACAPCAPDEVCPPCDCPDVPCDCPDTYEVHCEVIGSWCAPKVQTCTSDEDCLDGWECVEEPVPCACPPCECTEVFCGPDEVCPDIGECSCPPCECMDETRKVCLPEGWQDLGYYSGAENPEVAFTGTPKNGVGGPTAQDGYANGDATAPPASQTSSSGCFATATSSSLPILLLLCVIFLCGWRTLRVRRSSTSRPKFP